MARLLTDTARLTRDPGTSNDALDRTTLRLTPGPPTVVYEGPCLIGVQRQRDQRLDRGGQPVERQRITARLPADAPSPEAGDILTVLSSAADPTLVGRPLRVIDVARATVALTRQLVLESDSPLPAD
jgi:hypothetical protein